MDRRRTWLTGDAAAGQRFFEKVGRLHELPLRDGRSCGHRGAVAGAHAAAADALSLAATGTARPCPCDRDTPNGPDDCRNARVA